MGAVRAAELTRAHASSANQIAGNHAGGGWKANRVLDPDTGHALDARRAAPASIEPLQVERFEVRQARTWTARRLAAHADDVAEPKRFGDGQVDDRVVAIAACGEAQDHLMAPRGRAGGSAVWGGTR